MKASSPTAWSATPAASLPAITALLKLTSLASVISLRELLTVTSQTVAVNFRFAELYAAATVWYLAIVSVFMVLQAQLEKRYQWSSRERAVRTMPTFVRAGVGNR